MPPRRKSKIGMSEEIRPTYEAVVALTDAFCAEHLNEEYAALSRKMAETLARERPAMLASGKRLSWACGIVYALGRVNFLFDKSQTPHMRADELCKRCGVSPATGSAKANAILDELDIIQMDPEWCLPSRLEDNPLVWMLTVNGLIMDIRDAPREAQEVAFRKGLIPYIPADRKPPRR